MTADQTKLLRFYERGGLTMSEFAFRFVAATTERPTAECVARLPDEVVELIRVDAGATNHPRRFAVGSYCGDDIESWRRSQEEETKAWLAGLTVWREFFGFAG